MARVLIVEDEQMDRIILANIVERTGHEVYCTSDGERARKVHLKKSSSKPSQAQPRMALSQPEETAADGRGR